MRKYFCFSIKRGKVTNNCQLLFAKRTLFIPTASFFMPIRDAHRCIGIFDNRADTRAHASSILNEKCMHSALSVCNALIINVLSSVDNPLNNLHTRVHLSALVCALVCTPHTTWLPLCASTFCVPPPAFYGNGGAENQLLRQEKRSPVVRLTPCRKCKMMPPCRRSADGSADRMQTCLHAAIC